MLKKNKKCRFWQSQSPRNMGQIPKSNQFYTVGINKKRPRTLLVGRRFNGSNIYKFGFIYFEPQSLFQQIRRKYQRINSAAPVAPFQPSVEFGWFMWIQKTSQICFHVSTNFSPSKNSTFAKCRTLKLCFIVSTLVVKQSTKFLTDS